METKTITVLAIDDNPDNLLVLQAIMADALPQTTVLTAHSGQQGLKLARDQDPDVILLDIVMPGLDGFEVCRRLKADDRLQHVPVVFVTALKTDRESRIQALGVGAEAFLTKPLDEAELIAQVRAMAKIKAAGDRQRLERERLAELVAERTQELEQELVERRQAEQALRQANQQLQRNQAAMLNLLEDLKAEVDSRQRMKEALQESQERFRSLVEQAGDGFEMLDATGRYIDVNAATCRMLGYSRDEMLDLSIPDVDPLVDAMKFAADFQALIGQPPVTFETCHQRKDGTEFPVEVTASIVTTGQDSFALTLVRDITKRKREEEALRYQATLLRSMPDAVITTDLNFIIQGWNSAAEALYGWSAKETIGQVMGQVVPTEYPDDTRESALAQFQAEGRWKGQVVQKHRNGHDIHVLTSVTRVKDDAGRPLSVLASNRDITELKWVEEALRRSNQDLEQFASSISHDLQIPLHAVTSYLSLVAQRCQDQVDAGSAEFIRYALDEADRMQEITQSLLDLARVSTRGREFAPTDCAAVLAHVLRNLRFVIEDSGATVTHDPLPTVLADEGQLGQVFQNLIANALKFRGADPPRVYVWAEQEAGEWVFAVQDHGIGLDPAQAERAFQIFQRLHTQNEYEGIGIGLAICKKIVERHGGRIWVKSNPGQGATFYFTIGGGKHEQASSVAPMP